MTEISKNEERGYHPFGFGRTAEITEPQQEQPLSPKHSGPSTQSFSSARPLILVIDDNADMRDYLRRLLASRYDVDVVADGQTALERIGARLPGLVLTDVMTPRLDGFALLEKLRADGRTRMLPVIVLSARAGEEAGIEELKQGVDDYLTKPFSARELLARVQAHLDMALVRRQAEEAIRESEARFREMADNAPVMVWVTGPDASCTFLSKSWCEFTGQTPETGLGFGWVEAVHPDDRTYAQETFVAANAKSESFRLEYRLRRADGEYRWAIDAASPRFSKGGKFLGYIGSVIDITERKRIEQLEAEQKRVLEMIATGRPLAECLTALTEAAARLNPAVRAAVLMATVDRSRMADCHSTSLQPAFGASIHGAPISDLAIGTCGTAIFTGEPVTCADIANSDCWAPERRELCLAHGIRACHSTPVFGPNDEAMASFFLCFAEAREPGSWEQRIAEFGGHVAGIAIERDRVERAFRESEEKLRALAGQLEKLVDERTQELVQAHDRLCAMATELNLSEQRERKRLATELHDHLQQMLVLGKLTVGQGKRAAVGVPACEQVFKKVDEIFSEALTYTRTLVSDLSPTVLRDHGLAASIRWLGSYMQKYNQVVTVTVPDDGEIKLLEDQVILLFQSTRELLINSAKHAGTRRATLTMEQREGNLCITVSDEGKGFDSTAIGTPSSEISSKYGLLSIQERMRALGGSLMIKSAVGKGTMAMLVLPFGKPGVAECSMVNDGCLMKEGTSLHSALTIKHSPFQQDTKRIRVLLADDHVMVRQGLKTMLDAYADIKLVGEAGNGREAVDQAKRLRPDVVIMDINMPEMNGIEATRQITRDYPDTVVIGISVNVAKGYEQAMRRVGAVALMTKEAAVEQLYGAIVDAVKK